MRLASTVANDPTGPQALVCLRALPPCNQEMNMIHIKSLGLQVREIAESQGYLAAIEFAQKRGLEGLAALYRAKLNSEQDKILLRPDK